MQFTLLIHMHFISLVNVRVHVTRNHLIILIISFNKKRFSVVIFLAIFHDHIMKIQKRWEYQFFCQKSFLKDLTCLNVTRHFFYYGLRIFNIRHFFTKGIWIYVIRYDAILPQWASGNSKIPGFFLLSLKKTHTKLNELFYTSHFLRLSLNINKTKITYINKLWKSLMLFSFW